MFFRSVTEDKMFYAAYANLLTMVWKTNFLVDGELMTVDALLIHDKYFGMFDDFSSRASFKDARDIFKIGLYLDEKHFPKHIFFANFQCLRCGLCCKNIDWVQVSPELVSKWKRERRHDVLRHVNAYEDEIQAKSWTGCNLCRKVRNKPYYACRVNSDKERMFNCKVHLCSKSVPVAHLNFGDVDALISLVGLPGYFALIERDWNEHFDYSKCPNKTHKKT